MKRSHEQILDDSSSHEILSSVPRKSKLDSLTSSTDNMLIEENVTHVTVVGAGPAGLMLASNLVRFGVKTTILDERPDKTSTGRADGVQPKTIETLKQMGLAGPLFQKGVKFYDMCFWNSSPSESLRRTSRENHYPPEAVDVLEPFMILGHQGMVEDIFLEDMKTRGVEVTRSSPFANYSQRPDHSIDVEFTNLITKQNETFASQYLVGCDGAHSKVRNAMKNVEMSGEPGKSAWGVLDGVVDTDFPDLWSKVVISSETEGTMLCIPREQGMTRLYIELHPSTATTETKEREERATQESIIERARAILSPYKLEWTRIEWFGVYKVGQRVASRFSDESDRVFIAGDASHTHSPKAAQGMNVSLHDTWNLAWKLNLAVRGLALPTLLPTYQHERKKIAQDLIDFDFEHANAFAAGDPKALANNFAKNFQFISGVGAVYDENVLNIFEKEVSGGLKAGSLLSPVKVEKYIDANPVDLQLDIPMLGQFRILFFTRNVKNAAEFLSKVTGEITSPRTVLGKVTAAADKSYAELPVPGTELAEYTLPERYTTVSKVFTLGIVTAMAKSDVEISDLPPALQASRWTFYLDNIMKPQTCTEKWLGNLGENEVAIMNVRPDGYVGSIGRWAVNDSEGSEKAVAWLDAYYGAFLKA